MQWLKFKPQGEVVTKEHKDRKEVLTASLSKIHEKKRK